MDRTGLRTGHLVSLAGATLVLVTLWLPWFEVRFGPLERDEVARGAGQLGAPFAAIAQGFLAELDGLRLTAWDAFGGEDVALAAGAGIVVAVLVAAAGGAGAGVHVAPAAAARVARLGGLALGALVLVRLVDRPGPSELLQITHGGWLALAGCALTAVGGVLAGGEPATPVPSFSLDRAAAEAPGAHRDRGAVAGSVAPPGCS